MKELKKELLKSATETAVLQVRFAGEQLKHFKKELFEAEVKKVKRSLKNTIELIGVSMTDEETKELWDAFWTEVDKYSK